MERVLVISLLFLAVCALGGLAGHITYNVERRKAARREWEREHRLPDALGQYQNAQGAMESPIPHEKENSKKEEYAGA